ncbi:hypothetical protein H1P_5100002 [Hyella patelloides LEGE 07179]|uniref:Uncharacterized protein n=1 Tax=Hyella patelloides LEGE 07179 TaxID=945734 RepID=A0A563VZS9_9CYAN|nr:hypothetical protein H1P_5100002 [Hyella patelloides LEGE 07179]
MLMVSGSYYYLFHPCVSTMPKTNLVHTIESKFSQKSPQSLFTKVKS